MRVLGPRIYDLETRHPRSGTFVWRIEPAPRDFGSGDTLATAAKRRNTAPTNWPRFLVSLTSAAGYSVTRKETQALRQIGEE